jgi:hypothetical protein
MAAATVLLDTLLDPLPMGGGGEVYEWLKSIHGTVSMQ